jgi:protein-tyrosine-phosphatase/N-acetylglutamate synthase-like GNAT family acetyltransferase
MNTVIFACVHNAGRSQMAAAWFNQLSDPAKACAVSAGTEPASHVHPEVLQAMREVGIDLSGATPQKLTDEIAERAQVLITMGCGEACPVVPGLRRMDWPLEDPKGKPVERVRAIRDEVKGLVAALIAAEGWGSAVAMVPATLHDLDAVRRLLVDAELPTAGLLDQFPSAYVLAWHGGEVVGVAGLETYGTAGLLRSVVVVPALRRGGTGRALVANRLAAARARGLGAVYLLTTSAAELFRRLGFSTVLREQVPVDLAASPELSGACPASATCLVFQAGG